VTDALGRKVMTYAYDMLGHQIHQASMEAGARWILHDVTVKTGKPGEKDEPGKPVRTWDSRDHEFRTAYDPLRRPTDSFLREGAGAEVLVGRFVYGESQPDPEANNLRGKPFQLFDQAGVVTSDQYDFKGNLLRGRRHLAQAYKTTVDWSAAVPLHADTYTTATRYDALNRPTELTAPDNSVIRHAYNEASLLDRVDTNLRGKQHNGQPVWTPFVTKIDYDAKGQREAIAYGNGARTTYAYDPLTFRLVHLLTRREALAFAGDCPQPPPAGWPGCQAQNLHYTYDPTGNITHIRDDAQQTVYFRNQRVEPSADYTYDAVYRLIEASGREHLGQAGGRPAPTSYNDEPRVGLLQPGDGNAMARYVERYVYDAVGNFQELIHRGSDPAHPGWTRAYAYDEASQLEHGKHSNRLTSTTIGATTATYSSGGDGYDAHGNMLRMPQLHVMQWDFKDHLQMTQRQAVNADDTDGVRHQGERTWYVYDATGQRARKVTERQAAAGQTPTRIKERIYIGGFEVYRTYAADGSTVELERETLHVMDDKERIALAETRTQGNEGSAPQLIRYQFANHLGSSSLELDDQAQIISYEEYFPYGSTSYQAARIGIESAKRYRYTGLERDEETGLQYHSTRYYALWLSRWTSADPIGVVDGENAYAYCKENPVRNTDKKGTQTELNEHADRKNYSTPLKGSNWSLTLEPGITNIDYSPKSGSLSTSGPFKLDGQNIGIKSNFIAYDSRTAYFPPSAGPFTDQANRYLFTATNEYTGLLVTAGILHDKREQRDSAGNTFRYSSGGTEPTALIGKQFVLAGGGTDKRRVLFQAKIGAFLSYNNLDVKLRDDSGNTYLASSDEKKRSFSGEGLVATAALSYDLFVGKSSFFSRQPHYRTTWAGRALKSEHFTLSLSGNVTFMAGHAFSKVSVNGQSSANTLSVNYANLSRGIGVFLKYRF
jgi:RHS repeat-associated protein